MIRFPPALYWELIPVQDSVTRLFSIKLLDDEPDSTMPAATWLALLLRNESFKLEIIKIPNVVLTTALLMMTEEEVDSTEIPSPKSLIRQFLTVTFCLPVSRMPAAADHTLVPPILCPAQSNVRLSAPMIRPSLGQFRRSALRTVFCVSVLPQAMGGRPPTGR